MYKHFSDLTHLYPDILNGIYFAKERKVYFYSSLHEYLHKVWKSITRQKWLPTVESYRVLVFDMTHRYPTKNLLRTILLWVTFNRYWIDRNYNLYNLWKHILWNVVHHY